MTQTTGASRRIGNGTQDPPGHPGQEAASKPSQQARRSPPRGHRGVPAVPGATVVLIHGRRRGSSATNWLEPQYYQQPAPCRATTAREATARRRPREKPLCKGSMKGRRATARCERQTAAMIRRPDSRPGGGGAEAAAWRVAMAPEAAVRRRRERPTCGDGSRGRRATTAQGAVVRRRCERPSCDDGARDAVVRRRKRETVVRRRLEMRSCDDPARERRSCDDGARGCRATTTREAAV